MKLISIISLLILLFFVFQFTGCFSPQQTSSQSASLENKAINSPSKTPRIPDNPSTTLDQNFIKEWREKYDTTLAELEYNRKLWRESKITNYDFVIGKGGAGSFNDFRATDTLIKIRNGEKELMEAIEKDTAYNVESYNDFDTIDKLFDYLREKLDDRILLRVKYDKKLGYPKIINISFSYEIHGQNFIEISKLKVIKQI